MSEILGRYASTAEAEYNKPIIFQLGEKMKFSKVIFKTAQVQWSIVEMRGSTYGRLAKWHRV